MLSHPADDPLPDDVAALQALVGALSAQLAERDQAVAARDRIIDTLKGDGNDSFHKFTHRPGRTENASAKPMAVAESLYGIGLSATGSPVP